MWKAEKGIWVISVQTLPRLDIFYLCLLMGIRIYTSSTIDFWGKAYAVNRENLTVLILCRFHLDSIHHLWSCRCHSLSLLGPPHRY